MAAAIALAFSAYLRPAELMALRVGHLAPPCPAAQLPMWGLLLHGSDLGVPVDLDGPLRTVFAALRLRRRDSEEVWSLPAQQLRLNYQQAGAGLSLQSLSDSVERQFVQLLGAAKSSRELPLPEPTLPVRARARGRRWCLRLSRLPRHLLAAGCRRSSGPGLQLPPGESAWSSWSFLQGQAGCRRRWRSWVFLGPFGF